MSEKLHVTDADLTAWENAKNLVNEACDKFTRLPLIERIKGFELTPELKQELSYVLPTESEEFISKMFFDHRRVQALRNRYPGSKRSLWLIRTNTE